MFYTGEDKEALKKAMSDSVITARQKIAPNGPRLSITGESSAFVSRISN